MNNNELSVKNRIDSKNIKVPGAKALSPEDSKIVVDPSTNIESKSIDNAPSSQAETLLNSMWRSPDSCHQIGLLERQSKQFMNIKVNTVADAIHRALHESNTGVDCYFACAEYITENNRKATNVSGASAFWLDIDCGDLKNSAGKGYATAEGAREAVNRFCKDTGLPAPTYIVNSGSGLHVYWVLDSVVEREQWQQYAPKLKTLTQVKKLLADDSRTSDIASVLRIPGTLNHKYFPPKPVELICSSDEFIKKESMLDAIDSAHDKYCSQSLKRSNQHVVVRKDEYGEPCLKTLESALAVLDSDCDEVTWKLKRIAPLARAAVKFPDKSEELYQLGKKWSSGELRGTASHAWNTPGKNNGLTGEVAFEKVWHRFLNENPTDEHIITLGTIYHDAVLVGWIAPSAKLSPLETMQQHYALILMGGKFCVLDKRRLNPMPGQLAQRLELLLQSDARLLIRRAVKAQFPGVDGANVSTEFYNCPKTTCYDGVEFNPRGTSPNRLNLWVGPTLIPKRGDWSLIKSFLLEVICNNDQKAYDYLIRFIAHAIQCPEEKPGVMVILLGGQGIGKGTLARILQKIWSATFLQVNNIDTVTGSFNAALERSFIVFMDEALFSGDRRASDALKSLVTERLIHINEKHQPSRQMQSFHRFFAATNAIHFKNTESDDRRDFVLRVSEAQKGNHDYWRALNAEIENGGVAAMLVDLLAMDLSQFNVREKPETRALLEQKLLSLPPTEQWWYDCLDRGSLENYELGFQGDEWSDFISTDDAIKWIIAMGNRMFKKPTANDVVQSLMKVCPSATKGQRKTGGGRRRGLILPPLKQARVEFERYIGGTVSWSELED